MNVTATATGTRRHGRRRGASPRRPSKGRRPGADLRGVRGAARGRRAYRVEGASSAGLPAGTQGVLGCYADPSGRSREVVACVGVQGSTLVIDRDAVTLADQRLVARHAADEPAANAQLLCALYLDDPSRGRCRAVLAEDFEYAADQDDGRRGGETVDRSRVHPGRLSEARMGDGECESQTAQLIVDGDGRRYRLEPVRGTKAIPDLRWVMRDGSARSTTLSLREVIGRVQSYEPARAITGQALLDRARRPRVSVSLLRGELDRVDASRIVLNRGLREAVLGALGSNGLTASEIAIRCGRTKRDARGNVTGETSWVARRVGLAPEGGENIPTPWVHSDVLALIARCGLGVSPREVELG